jgi:putative serine protease PepD
MNLGPHDRRLRRLLPLIVAVAIGAGAGAGAYALTSSGSSTTTITNVVAPAQPASATSTVDSLTQLYRKDSPGVVDITTTLKSGGALPGFPFGFPQQGQQTHAEGTGFVIDTKGDILTAEHVVDGATSIRVRFANGSSSKATVVGSDKSTDTAVVHVDVPSSQLHPLALGNSSAAQPGETVVAIGSPFGYAETMTAGIVSATNRTITAPNRFSVSGAIQTDAAINHGNSGGPLIDAATNTVIGVNDQIVNEGDTQDNAGVGFAVPIEAAKRVAQTIIAGGTVRHAYLGVRIADATSGGAQITMIVQGAPAAKAGLKAGDVVTAFDGKPVASADSLTAAVSNGTPGERVKLTIKRHGATKHISVTLGLQPASPAS